MVRRIGGQGRNGVRALSIGVLSAVLVALVGDAAAAKVFVALVGEATAVEVLLVALAGESREASTDSRTQESATAAAEARSGKRTRMAWMVASSSALSRSSASAAQADE